ncbi:hypothetical protein [Actinoplanes sp. NPDC049599]|uniref:hypothetical protein n=1 Tax=Actinoplanes sp. NPDC049599 TaxID=3363903 RepID=UPI0037A6AA96
MDRSDCSARPSHHHRPARPRHQDCDDNTSHRHRPARRDSAERETSVHSGTTGRRAKPDQIIHKLTIRTAKAARSDSRRRSAVTERPQNVRPARTADRTHNSNRHQSLTTDRSDGTQTTTATRAHRGSHRAERMHRTDDHIGARHRSSRMGRHHLDQRRDHQDHQQNRW